MLNCFFFTMNKSQFLILNVLAVLFLLLTGVRFLLVKDLESKRSTIAQVQAVVSQGRESEQVLRRIILRLNQSAQREPDLRDLLKQFNVKVTNSPAQVQPAAAPISAPVKPKS